MAEERKQTDFMEVLASMRNGEVMRDLSQKFNEVLTGVLDTGGKGELTVTFKIEPSKLGMGGIVLEVSAEHKTKIKRPELEVGASTFFVGRDGRLTREDPRQTDMFVMVETQKEHKN